MTAKQQFYEHVLGGLKERGAYFSRDTIQAAADEAGLALKKTSLSVYLNQAVKQGLIHDAGRGWYSRLAEPVRLDRQPVAKLVRLVEKKFPLLEFTVWSTAQINPWMHHLLAKPVTFLHAPREALETIGETLREQGWEVTLNPGKREAAKLVRPGEKMVVLRPILTKQPPPQGQRLDSIEKILVNLLGESSKAGLMDPSEAAGVFRKIAASHLLQIAVIQRYAENREIAIPDFEVIN